MAYPPDDEIITIFSEIFIYLKDLISSMTPSLVIPFLSIARVGFCKWLSDAQEIFMPTELSAVVSDSGAANSVVDVVNQIAPDRVHILQLLGVAVTAETYIG